MKKSLKKPHWLVLAIALLTVAHYAIAAGPNIPRPEHPFPQMERGEWLNLNGPWQFAEDPQLTTETLYLAPAKAFPETINVPFCRESKLSGLEHKGFMKCVYYRRGFTLPEGWKSPRTLLHIGACDWSARVWVNGQFVGEHKGGMTPVNCDITSALKKGENTIVIRAFDDLKSGMQGGGKQSWEEKSFGCLYTRTTGIWQTVWLEGVGASYIKDITVTADPTDSSIILAADVVGPVKDLKLEATALAAGKKVGRIESAAGLHNSGLLMKLKKKHLWAPGDPFLYDLKLTLTRGGKAVDEVSSYFGLRTVTVQGAAILINGQPIFQRLILDQGFYPEGIWTAPSDESLKHDIELSMAAGFNGARLHQKVFDPRYHYWADKLGYMVWGEYCDWGLNQTTPASYQAMIDEWVQILRRDRNHPSIVGWCPFNESAPGANLLQNTVAGITRAADPTRPLLDVSGYTHTLADAEVMDMHDYEQDPKVFRTRYIDNFKSLINLAPSHGGYPNRVPYFLSEYGGIGWELGSAGWGYGNSPKSPEEFYKRYEGLTNVLLDQPRMFGFCYTQLTDVEQEHNGLYTYARKPKFDVGRLRAITSRQAAYEKNPPLE